MTNHGKSRISTDKMVHLYTVEHLTMEEIGAIAGISRMAVSKRFKKTCTVSQDGEWVKTSCDWCDVRIMKRRKQWRTTTKHFCSEACYWASLENPGYKPWRQGCRLARAIVNQYFKLEPGHVVHHKDGDNRNNNIDNLAVFANQGDHGKWHRSGAYSPVWDGSSVGS